MLRLNRFLLIAFCSLLVYMPFHVFVSQWASSLTGGLDIWKVWKDIFTAGLALACILAVLAQRKYTKLYLWLLGLSALYAALHLIVFWATDQPLDTGLLATTYNLRLMCYAIIGYSVALLIPHTSYLIPRKIIKILLIVSTIVCVLALLQWVLPKDIMAHFGYSLERGARPAFFIDDKPDLPRVFSTLRDPNSLGAFLILPITLLSYGLLKFWQTNRRLLIGGLLLLHGLILFLTFGRGAWLGAMIAVAVMLGLYQVKLIKKVAKQYLPLVIVAVLLLGGLVFLLRDHYIVQNVVFHSDENTQQTDSNNLHLQYIQKGLDGIADQPLGHGPGTAGLVSIHNEQGGLLTENYYVQIAYEVGLLGLLILIAFMALIFGELWQKRKEPLALALIGSFVGLTLMNLLLHTWTNEAVAISWFMLAGWCLVHRKIPSKV